MSQTYNLLDDDGLLYAVQYIFTKLSTSPLNVNTTYSVSLDTTNQYIVLTGSDGNSSHVSYADFGEKNVLEGVQIDGTDLTITNKKVNIPMAGSNVKGVVTNEAINALINAALADFDRVSFVKVSSYAALPQLYNSTTTYVVDDYCIQNNMIYKCNTAVSVPEVFDPNKWTAVSKINGIIFLVPLSSSGTGNKYDEYVWMPIDYTTTPITYGYEKIGTTDIDLSGYVQYTDISLITNQEIADIVDDAYDAVFNPQT